MTKEEILYYHTVDYIFTDGSQVTRPMFNDALKNGDLKPYFDAMEQYSGQQTKELQSRVEQLQAKIDELEKANEWISVEEHKPFNAGLYLCYTNDEQIMVCFLSTNGWWSKVPDASFYGDMGNKIVINSKEVEREVTHWKPLPQAPTNK